MSVLRIANIGGIEPSVPARALPDNGAQVAQNLNAVALEFRPLREDVQVASVDVPNARCIYRFDRTPDGSLNTDETQGWKATDLPVSIARVQLGDDKSGKIYYTPIDGSQPMRWHNAQGQDRHAGIPAPQSAPIVERVEQGYLFTLDARVQEMAQVQAQAVEMAKARAQFTWIGPQQLPMGWVRRSDFVPADHPMYATYVCDVVRVFAVDPGTGAVLDTFSDIHPDLTSWVFDPALGGGYVTVEAGASLPSWGAGYTRFWCLGMRAYASGFDLNEELFVSDVLQLKMPGTQGQEPLLTQQEAQALARALSEHGDKDGARIAPLASQLQIEFERLQDLFTRGARATIEQQMQQFYERSDVSSTINNALEAFAQQIWRYAQIIGQATATPYYSGD